MKLTFLFTLLVAGVAYAGPVVTTCDTVVGDERCHSAYTAGNGSDAMGSVTLELASNPADWNTLSTYQYAHSVEGYAASRDAVLGPGSRATVAINYSQAVVTTGPERSGYLQIHSDDFGGGSVYDGSIHMISGLVLDPVIFGNTTPLTQITCDRQGCAPGPGYYGYYSRIPVTLGTAFTLQASGSLLNVAAPGDGQDGAQLTTTYEFRFFESDGVTPVRLQLVSEAPEPGTWALTLLATAGTIALRRSLLSASR